MRTHWVLPSELCPAGAAVTRLRPGGGSRACSPSIHETLSSGEKTWTPRPWVPRGSAKGLGPERGPRHCRARAPTALHKLGQAPGPKSHCEIRCPPDKASSQGFPLASSHWPPAAGCPGAGAQKSPNLPPSMAPNSGRLEDSYVAGIWGLCPRNHAYAGWVQIGLTICWACLPPQNGP